MSTETAREFLAEQKRLADAATEGPWEHGDRWHIQGADFCQCAASSGPLVEERRMDINGEMMLAHVHRREEPWYEYGILSAARGRDGFPPHVVIETTEYGTMDAADAEFIAASRTTVPRLIAALEAVLALHRVNGPNDGSCQGYGTPTGRYGYLDKWCVECSERSAREYGTTWPCSTARAIEAALGGDTEGFSADMHAIDESEKW